MSQSLFALMAVVGPLAASAPSDAQEGPPEPLQVPVLTQTCPQAETGEIVVCGRRDDDRYRLRPIFVPRGVTMPEGIPTRFPLGGGAVGEIDVIQVERPDGWVDRRVLVHVRVPF